MHYALALPELDGPGLLEEVVAEAAPAALTDEVAGYGFDNEREEVGVMLKAATQDLVDVAETLDMALSATQERGGAEGAATAQRAQTESTGIELQSLTKYSLKDRNVIEGYLDAVDQEVLEAAQTYREDKNAKFRRIKLGDVQQREAEAIKGLLGVDVSGYTHNIDKNGFNHIEKRHGANGIADHSMADLNDVARLAWIIRNYDTVELVRDESGELVRSAQYLDSQKNHAPVLLYKKKINGVYYLSEAVADNAWKKLWVTSAYMNKRGVSETVDASLRTPDITSKNENPATPSASVADSEAAVNPSAQISQEQRELSDGETRFSLKSTSALNQDTQLLLEGEDVQVDAQSVQAYARDALRADCRKNRGRRVRRSGAKCLSLRRACPKPCFSNQ